MFSTHKLNEKGFAAVKEFKNTMAEATQKILPLMPEGRSKALFLTNLDTAMFNGTKAIAELPENHTEIIEYPVA